MHYILLGVAGVLLGVVASKSTTGGIEFVKACDSSADDVTNQCINRIPDNVGVSSGNHACAYHEAEVRCLGLCGNTMTWKVAYNNALKRYRLVCASYIDERIADKEESGEMDGDSESPRPKKSSKKNKAKSEEEDEQAEDDEGSKPRDTKKSKKDEDGADKKDEDGADKKDEDGKSKAAKSTDAKASKSEASKGKPSPTKSASTAKPTESSQAKVVTIKVSTKTAGGNDGEKTGANRKAADDKEKNGKEQPHAMLPTMDPELADSAPAASSLGLAAVLLSVAAALF
ncbi:hypothetical protein GGF43_003167 [Coemansia sp. RSA 2618]|nr:hypothetical protein GGF43_003167 [Coemansia sp. RSA 2618]